MSICVNLWTISFRQMLKKSFILIVLFAFSLAACRENLPEKSSENYSSAVRSFYVGLAALQVGDDQRAKDELKKATEFAASEPAAWNNLGVLELRQKDFENASKSLEKAKQLAPDNGKIYANLAVLETQRGNFDKAIENWTKTIDLESNNVQAIYALAQERERQANDEEALKLYDKIARAKPENLAVKLEIARLSAKKGDGKVFESVLGEIGKAHKDRWSAEIREQFDKTYSLANDLKQAAIQISYLRNVLLREPAFRAAIAEIKPSDTAIGEPFVKPLKLPVPDFSPAEPDLALTFSAQPTENIKANFAKAIFLNGENPPVAAWSNEKETRVGKTSLPVAASNSNQFAAFDFDFDFKNDLAFATEKGFRLFKQTENENFADVTAQTKIPKEILQKFYAGVWTLDVESDGDLDLILSDATVLQNNSDSSFSVVKTFEKIAHIEDFAWADVDEDGDSDVVVLDSINRKIRLFSNKRGGIFTETEISNLTMIVGFDVGDLDGDGSIDLLFMKQGGSIFRTSFNPDKGNFESQEIFNLLNPICGKSRIDETKATLKLIFPCEIKTADFDNNGAKDILVSGLNVNQTHILLAGKDKKFSLVSEIISQISSVAETNGDGKLDLIGIDADGKPAVFQNKSEKNYHWQILRPRAAKTEGDQRVNSYGIGGEMEIRSGLLAQKQIVASPQVHFGLGERDAADVLRVVWGNGYVQAEFDLKADQTIAAEQRLKGSCPHLFAWDGMQFRLVKDAPPWSPALGLKINAQDTYGVLQTEEWFKIAGEFLKPKDGFYELRITGEYWESFYIDNYQLLVIDHPETTEIFTDERFAIPLPPLKVFTTEKTSSFTSARNDKGEDVAEIVKTLDEKYLDGFKRGTFQGVAEEHFVELELPENAPKDKTIRLVGDGWIHPTDASINVQLGQSSKEKPKSLSLEVEDESGNWRVAKENLGFPAGKMKTVLIDLPAGAKRFRLRTNMEIFWDKLAWTADISENQNKENRLQLAQAELRYRGFSVIEKANDSSPEKPVYDKLLTTNQRWRDLEGYYTRFGDIKELLSGVDDRFVLANAGDEIVLKFPALPEVQAGWTRDFVIIGNGWIKDGDLNSVFSKTLLPLPTHATNDYSRPPTRLEDDAVYQKNKLDWLNFHTRYVAPDLFRNALRSR